MKYVFRRGPFATLTAAIRTRRAAGARVNRPLATRLRAECVEDRCVPATFTVNTLADTVDADPGVTSLREAIVAANDQAGDDVIDYGVTGTINLTGPLPDLSSNIQLLGPGAANLTVRRDTGGDYRIFTIASDTTVEFDGMTIANGNALGDGGAIYATGNSLTVNNCTLSGNTARLEYVIYDEFFPEGYTEIDGSGGGIYSSGGTLSINNSTLVDNTAGEVGGGICCTTGTLIISGSILVENDSIWGGGISVNGGTITVSHSAISDNTSWVGGGVCTIESISSVNDSTLSGNSAGDGAGIFSYNGTLTISHSTLSGNSASRGGGIFNDSGTLTVSNSTISSNYGEDGGGICNFLGTVTITSVTLWGNSGVYGAGICNGDRIGQVIGAVTMNNAIVANNPLGVGLLMYGTMSGSHNLVEDASDNLPDTITGDPLLGPLADNGGPTLTHALLAGSPAIDAGDDALAVDPTTGLPLTTDQRGEPYARIDGAHVDIGAYEFPAPAVADTIINGTSGNDLIRLQPSNHAGEVEAYVNGTLVGTYTPTGNLVVYGLEGDDDIQVTGNLGVPVLLDGGDGNDTLTGSNGNESLTGGAGNDTLKAGSGDDVLDGGADDDWLVGSNGDDTLTGGTGNDTLDGGSGEDWLDGGNGNNRLEGGNGDDTLRTEEGNDTLDGGSGRDDLDAGEGDDVLAGGNGDDVLLAGGGNDDVDGGSGDDSLDGGTGYADSLIGGNGDDTMTDVDGVARADGGSGNDHILLTFDAGWNLNGSTSLLGTAVSGGNGDDVIELTANNPAVEIDLNGNSGNDQFILHGVWSKIRVYGGTGTDTVFSDGIGLIELYNVEVGP